MFFNFSFSDTAGNLVDSINAGDTTTDGSWIRFDGILPFLNFVSFYFQFSRGLLNRFRCAMMRWKGVCF